MMLVSVLLFFAAMATGSSGADSWDETTISYMSLMSNLDAFEFARREEKRLNGNQCSVDKNNSACVKSNNKGEWQSAYLTQECLTGPNLVTNDNGCSSSDNSNKCLVLLLWDFSMLTRKVRIPGSSVEASGGGGIEGKPTTTAHHHKLTESVCFSEEEWPAKERKASDHDDMEYRATHCSNSHNNVEQRRRRRQFNESESGGCNPRTRSCYIATQSVVSMLTSLSSTQQHHEPIVVGDNGCMVVQAMAEDNENLRELIGWTEATKREKLHDVVKMDFMEAFVDQEYTSGCNTALLFLTDGKQKRDAPGTKEESNHLMKIRPSSISKTSGKSSHRISKTSGKFGHYNDIHIHQLHPAQLISSAVELSSSGELADDAFSSCYCSFRLFALGLGSTDRSYSEPVYNNRTKTKAPLFFLGVVGGPQFTIEHLNAALASSEATDGGYTNNAADGSFYTESIQCVDAATPDASCWCPPTPELLPCALPEVPCRVLPGGGGGYDVACASGSRVSHLQLEEPCQTEPPKTFLFGHVNPRKICDLSYEELIRCLVVETAASSDQCYAEEEVHPSSLVRGIVSGGVIIVAVVTVIFICSGGGCCFCVNQQQEGESSCSENQEQANNKTAVDNNNPAGVGEKKVKKRIENKSSDIVINKAIPIPENLGFAVLW